MVNLNESLIGFLVSWIIFWMIFYGEFSICFFDLLKRGVSRYFKDIIEVSFSLRIMLIKEFLLIVLFESKLLIESLESFGGIIDRELLIKKIIIIRSFISIWECLICLWDLIEIDLCISSIILMFVWMPESG